MKITRETLLERDAIRSAIRAAGGDTSLLFSDEQMTESLEAMLAVRPAAPDGDAWVFGYGSLMWNPAFHFAEQRSGRLWGYHRRFCLWTPLGRGSPDCPGLVLGLDRGGSCKGVVFRIAAQDVRAELEIIWRREMVTGAYSPRWLTVMTPAGPVVAIAFVINPAHPRYAGLLPADTVEDAIAQAEGFLGPCADYLTQTVERFDALGITERGLRDLCGRVILRRTP